MSKNRGKSEYVIGLDEVGRGPLAGRVFVGAFALPVRWRQRGLLTDAPARLADSKRLTPRQREAWFEWICRREFVWHVTSVSPSVIDRINVSQAANRAAGRALERLLKHFRQQRVRVIADGTLHVRNVSREIPFENHVRADERFAAVSLASIVAKVKRDRHMTRIARRYPQYGFETHKGYGTKKHYAALARHGPCEIHRLTFVGGKHKLKTSKS